MESLPQLVRALTEISTLHDLTLDVQIDRIRDLYSPDAIASALSACLKRCRAGDPETTIYLYVLSKLRGERASALARDLAEGKYTACDPETLDVRRAVALTISHQMAGEIIPAMLHHLTEWSEGAEYLIWRAGIDRLHKALYSLRDMLRNDRYLSRFAALALGRIGESEDIRALLEIVAKATSYDGTESLAGFSAAGLGFGGTKDATSVLLPVLETGGPLAHIAARSLRQLTGFDAGWSAEEEPRFRADATQRFAAYIKRATAVIDEPDYMAAQLQAHPLIWAWQNLNGLGKIRIETELGGPGSWLEWYRYLWVEERKLFQVGSICGTCRYWLNVCDPSASDTLKRYSGIKDALSPGAGLSEDIFARLWPLLQILRPGRYLAAIVPLKPNYITTPIQATNILRRVGPNEHTSEGIAACWDCYATGTFPLGTDVPGYPPGSVTTLAIPTQPSDHLSAERVARYRLSNGSSQPLLVALGQLELHLPVVDGPLPSPEALLRMYLIDGHHRIRAAADAGESCTALLLLPLNAVHSIAPSTSEDFAIAVLEGILGSATKSW